MACIKALNRAITYACQPGSVGIAEMYLMNFDDLTGGTVDPVTGTLSGVTLKSGAKTIPVECYKNGAKFTEALKLSDVSAGLDQSVMFTLYEKNANARTIMSALLSGRFMAAIKLNDINSTPIMAGYKCGLEISQADTDSNANGGFTTITIKTPDDARGENGITIASASWTVIVNAKLA